MFKRRVFKEVIYLLFLFLFVLFPFKNLNAEGVFENSGGGEWSKKQEIQINPDKVDGNMHDFPLLIAEKNVDSSIFWEAKSDGCDIRFSAYDDLLKSGELAFEKVYYSTSTSEVRIWVKVPLLSSTATTSIWIWWGNSQADCYLGGDIYGSQNTWNDNYKRVYHMNDLSGSIFDSTGNGNGIKTGDGSPTYGVDGIFGDAIDFDGSTYYRANAGGIEGMGGDISLQFWIKGSGDPKVTNEVVLSEWDWANDIKNFVARVNKDKTISFFSGDGGDNEDNVKSLSTINDNSFTKIDLVRAAGVDLHIYTDGLIDVSNGQDSAGGGLTNQPTNIGGKEGKPTVISILDEVRILATALSEDWISTEYNNQNSPETFAVGQALNEEPDPVVLVPGIVGSWEFGGEWKVDPILRTYDNLIEAMLDSGYELDSSLFLFPYDWRNDNVYTAQLLQEKIEEIRDETGKDKVDIVAHSMGGLVSRQYIQSDEYSNDVDQLIFLDTPHLGSPESYLPYEGGYFNGGFSAVIKTFVFQAEATKYGYANLSEYIREKVPSTGQLLPIYDYLQNRKRGSWTMREYPEWYPQNTFLEDLNTEDGLDDLRERSEVINFMSSDGVDSTLSSIKVVPYHKRCHNMWMHGYPYKLFKGGDEAFVMGAGDGTVPRASLDSIDDVEKVYSYANHREIVTKSQQDVIEYLTGERPGDYIERGLVERMLFIRVYSPVDFLVTSPSGKKSGKDISLSEDVNEIEYAFYSGHENEAEFVTIINPEEGEYKIDVQGVGDGEYKLGVDILEENSKTEEENLIWGTAEVGSEETYSFTYTEDMNNEDLTVVKTGFDEMIDDVIALYDNGEIKKKFIKLQLTSKLKNLKKLSERNRKYTNKYIKFVLKGIERRLEFYKRKGWITENAYDVLVGDIEKL